MRTALLIFLAVLTTISVHAQTLRGIVIDGETNQPLYLVNVLNLANAQSTSTDERGIYTISAKNGDVLSFSYVGYHTIQRLAITDSVLRISMFPLSVALKEYILHPEYTPYQKDSVEMAMLYSDQLNTNTIKPGFSSANGGGFTGLIGGAVQKVSKSYKQKKRFRENFLKDEQQKYIDTRYTPQLVTALTNLTGDTLAVFMNTYPMEYKFARTATDLELKLWIRDNYKDYLLHKNPNGPFIEPAKK